MLRFNKFIAEETLRQGLPHVSNLDYNSVGNLVGSGVLSGSSTRKTDGAAGEVGYDEQGPYTRSGRSGKVRKTGEYTTFTKNKRGEDADTSISSQYDDMHDKLMNNTNLISYLKDRHEKGLPSSIDRKSTRLNSSHTDISRMPSSA